MDILKAPNTSSYEKKKKYSDKMRSLRRPYRVNYKGRNFYNNLLKQTNNLKDRLKIKQNNNEITVYQFNNTNPASEPIHHNVNYVNAAKTESSHQKMVTTQRTFEIGSWRSAKPYFNN